MRALVLPRNREEFAVRYGGAQSPLWKKKEVNAEFASDDDGLVRRARRHRLHAKFNLGNIPRWMMLGIFVKYNLRGKIDDTHPIMATLRKMHSS